MRAAVAWRGDWDAQNPLDIATGFTARDDGEWVTGRLPGVGSRDLGLADATGGLLSAHHLRATGAPADSEWQYHDVDFQWFFVLKGSVRVRAEDGEELTLQQGDSAYQPPYWRYQLWDMSADYEAVEVMGPASYATVTGEDAVKPDDARPFARPAAVYNLDRPDNYVRGDGPRAWSLYRDLETREPTDGRVHIHVIALDTEMPSPEGGTGDHAHSMAQWFLPLRGWIDISADDQPDRRVHAGDFVMLGRGVTHNASDASSDYMTLEFCVPAHYDTDPR